MAPRTRPPRLPLVIAFRNCRRAFVFAALFSCVINILMLTGPLFMMQVYDRVLASRSAPTLIALSAVAVVLYAFMGLLEFVRTRLMVRIGNKLDEQLRDVTFSRVLEHSIRRNTGIGTQPLRDLDVVRQFVASPAPFALFDMPWAPVYLAVNAIFHPLLGILSLAGAVLLFTLAAVNEFISRSGSNAAAKASLTAHALSEEAHSAAEVIRVMGFEANCAALWSKNFGSAVELQARAADRASVFSSLSKTLRLVLQSAALALGAWLVIQGELTAGAMIAASIIMSRALAPVEQAIAYWRSFLNYRRSKQRLSEALAPLGTDSEPMRLPEPTGRLSVEQVFVMAPGAGNGGGQPVPLLYGIHFALEPGDGLAIAGPTGAGKSSLARALVGAWPAAKGAIRLDGAELGHYPSEQLGARIGYLPQDVTLLQGAIRQNIARFDPDADPEKVVKAAKDANVHELIQRLPEGYNTRLGADGVQLSGGHRQRIGLARAFYGDPVLVVLDEPNSNLDAEGEAALLSAIETARQRRATVIIIAHRLNALQAVNKLLYLRDGRQVAFGPKDEVLAKMREGERAAQANSRLAVYN
jgi:PrtD family type I secretion system ABC transporter